ncbi:hypothetical protein RhiirA5_422241 [Rhizophagus irregularis]|uniref:Uncharacterized protein n=1 Tax=Rhizophagus irregularis TaxID=588596 RepID=A0A2N0PC88_9GLOM|nr:hypothetical protein RhiirA5_422241 [Rhizophagus irregularis]PKC60351.1 hypothetical protein RhiirA1_468153 [Rhizophagus irregularis]
MSYQMCLNFNTSFNNIPIDKCYHYHLQSELSGRILRDTLGFGSKGRIMEQQWQKEFYRIGTQVLGMDHFLSCKIETVFGCEGEIDFYVDKLASNTCHYS